MPHMKRDYYQEARSIAADLSAQGLTNHAATIHDAVEAGSTGTEILMALRYALRQVQKEVAVLPPMTEDSMARLLAALDRELA